MSPLPLIIPYILQRLPDTFKISYCLCRSQAVKIQWGSPSFGLGTDPHRPPPASSFAPKIEAAPRSRPEHIQETGGLPPEEKTYRWDVIGNRSLPKP